MRVCGMSERTTSAELLAAAEAKRQEAQRIYGGVGVPERAGARLSARGLGQAHRRTDSALRRFTDLTAEADLLAYRAALAAAREAEAARVRFTHSDVIGARLVRTSTGWHKVVRVSPKSVTVETGYSWTDRIPHEKLLEVRT